MTFPIRPAREGDIAFILDAWKKSYEGAPAVRGAHREHYRTEMTRAIRRLCERGEVRIATAPDDDDHLLGFAAFTQADDGAELHYVYVKQDFRKLGIARALLAGVDVTAYTFVSNTARPPKGWAYKPRMTI